MRRGLLIGLAIMQIWPAIVAGQVAGALGELRGRVTLAGDTTVMVVGAEIELVPLGLREHASGDGRFRFADVVAGTYELRVRRLGYKWGKQRVVIEAGRVTTVDVELQRAVQGLSEVVIAGQRVKVPPGFEAVYERGSRGWGKLFTRDEIERANPVDLKSLLATLPTVLVNDRGITFQRCQAGIASPMQGATITSGTSGNVGAKRRPGKIQVYVDGVRLTRTTEDDAAEADAEQVIKRVLPSTVAAIEVYTGVARIPAEFLADACAVIAIWTKRY